MIVVLAFSPADIDQALVLMDYIGQLGGCHEYDCLLVADAAVDWAKCVDMLSAANRTFRVASIVCTESAVSGWPVGANALWLTAAKHCHATGTDWLWVEPDAIPLKRGWLQAIDKMRGSRFFGHVYDCHQPGLPRQLLSGVAVYPADAVHLIGPCMDAAPDRAWDVASAEAVLRHTTPTRLIQHFWGEKDLPPTFAESKGSDSPRNTFTLANLWPEAVIFHRNKDGTLINLLRRKMRMALPGNFIVVLPFCNLDALQLVKNLDWMKRLGTPKTHDCLLSFDNGTNRQIIRQITVKAREVFCNVQTTSYHVPHGTRFPQTAAWQHAARTMRKLYRSWLWLEADAIPLKKQWLEVLQSVYDNCRMPFCGPMVQGASHMNGTPAIYPADTPELLPRTMSHTSNAWDVECADEIRGKVKDIGHIAFAAWGIKDGRLNPLEGEAPSFPPGRNDLLNQIPRTAVVFHRDKGGTLIDRLTK